MPRLKRLHNYPYKPVHSKKYPEAPDLKTISGGGCWCGKPMNHDWPGMADGAPHPR